MGFGWHIRETMKLQAQNHKQTSPLRKGQNTIRWTACNSPGKDIRAKEQGLFDLLIFISPNKLWPILYNRRGSYPTYFRRIAFISETHHIIYQIQPIPQNSQEQQQQQQQQQQPPPPPQHQEKNNQPLPSGLKWCLRTLCREALEPQILDTRFTMGFLNIPGIPGIPGCFCGLSWVYPRRVWHWHQELRKMSESEQHDLQVIHSRWASLNQNHTKTRKESMVVQICCFWDVYGMFWKQKWYNCDLLSSFRDSLHINDTPSLSNPPLHSPCAHRCRRCSQSMKYGLHRRSGEKCHWNNAIANSLVHSRCILSVVDIWIVHCA